MRRIVFAAGLLFMVNTSCTKQHVIDTGIADPHYDGNIMGYLRSDPFNWKLTVQLIEHAGLVSVFDGTESSSPIITFFAFTSQSVERFLYDSQYSDSSHGKFEKVTDIPVQLARSMVLRHVVAGRYTRLEVAFSNRNFPITHPEQDGGTNLRTLDGNVIKVFREQEGFGSSPDGGPVWLRVFSITRSRTIPVASADIQANNGVVHSLNYTYAFPEI